MKFQKFSPIRDGESMCPYHCGELDPLLTEDAG